MARRKDNSGILIFILILAIVGYFMFFKPTTELQAFITPETQYMSQYGGQPCPQGSWSWIQTHSYPLSFASTSVIRDYKIELEKSSSGTRLGEPYCQTNTCGGTQIGTDEDGCAIYEATRSEEVTADLGCTCGSSGCGKCDSKTFSFAGQITSCEVTGGSGSDKGCSINGNEISCGGCIPLKSGGNCADVKCTAYYKVQCGGLVRPIITTGEGCWSKYKIYYKNELIEETDWDNQRRQDINLIDGTIINTYPEREKANLKIVLHTDFQYLSSNVYGGDVDNRYSCDKGCQIIVSEFIFKLQPEDFILNISAIKEQVIEGELVTVNVSIINNYAPVIGKMFVDFEVPTVIGSAKKQEVQLLNLPLGQSDHLFEIPSTQVTDKILVTPKIDFLMEGSDFQGVNYQCYGQTDNKERDLSNCQYVKIGTIQENTFTVRIISEVEALRGEIGLLEEDIEFLQASLIEKAQLINSLNLNLQEQADLINTLGLKASEQAILISNLNLTISEQASLITQLESKASEQASIINNLELTISQQAELINDMDLEISEQLTIINNLNINLEQKRLLISQLEITTSEQEYLIEQMKGSFAEQAGIINELNLTIQEDADYINSLQLSVEAQAGIINELKLTISQQAEMIGNLELTNQEMGVLISNLELTVSEQSELIDSLKLSNQEMAEIIDNLNLNLDEQVKLISDLRINLDDKVELVRLLNIKVEEQNQIISQLQKIISEQPTSEEGFKLSDIPFFIWIMLGIFILLLFLSKKK